MIDYDKINMNEYALKLRRDGKTFKQIGDELGVSIERARQRVAWGSSHEDKLELHEAATTMGDLFMSARAMNTINTLSALDMTFDEFLENVSYKKMMHTPNLGKVTAKEIINTLKEKNVSEEKLAKWEGKNNKIKPYQAIAITIQSVCKNPDIKPKDRMKQIATILEPMLNEIFGSEYEPYEEEKKNDR